MPFHGKNGVVYSDTDAVAEVTEFDYNDDAKLANNTTKGDTSQQYAAGIADGGGKVSCLWDPTDTNGQNTLRQGQVVDLHLYPDGNVTARIELTGSVTIETMTITSPLEDMNKVDFTFKGVLTESAVPA